ncbi:MAG: hypothetical protein IKQ97_07125 [Eubacterium sp.]|nr:hypothetical protein [Eubacterium sp.]
MEKMSITCNNCGSVLHIETGRNTFFCEFCGAKIIIDDGVKRSEHIIHKVDEARLEELRFKKEKYERDLKEKERQREIERAEKEEKRKQDLILQEMMIKQRKREKTAETVTTIALLFLLGGMLLFSIYHMDKSEKERKAEEAAMQAAGMIHAGSSSDYLDKDYEGVIKQFEELGFEDIQAIDIGDEGFLWKDKGKVESVSIAGDSSFSSSDFFYLSDKVIISYH